LETLSKQETPTDAPTAGLSTAVEVLADVQVLVVGYGPVGAALANLLGRYGVRVLVVDKATEIFMAPRAIALDNEALRILQLAGLSEDDFERIAIPYVRMRSPLLGEFGRVNTLGSIDGHPKLVTFYQPHLERALRRRAAQYAQVQTRLGATLLGLSEQAEGVTAQLKLGDGRTAAVNARYVIGADGASSLVRQLIGQQFQGETYAEDWLIVDACQVPQPIDHIEFLCDHRRPTPHMCAPGQRERWEFMLRRGETRAEMESDTRIRELLAPWGVPEDLNIERKAVYRFHARAVDSFSRGRVFLAGDAAHITPPFVGQGLVAGLRDAANLCWKLAWVVHGQAAPHILGSYDQERRPHAKAMIGLAKFMGKLVMPRNLVTAFFMHGAMRLLRCIPGLRDYFEELGIKPPNVFRRGLFVPGGAGSKLQRGGMLPQSWVRGADGTVVLSDEALGPTLSLIGFGLDAAKHLEAGTTEAFAAAGGSILQITHSGQRMHRAEHAAWEDLEGAFLPRVARFGWVAVVRPDRTILHDGPIGQVNQIVRESLACLGSPAARPAAAPLVAARAA
jgi:3-(3-hydroxy-phenyl)propionate hydroxylase